jgi:hypothetical protein
MLAEVMAVFRDRCHVVAAGVPVRLAALLQALLQPERGESDYLLQLPDRRYFMLEEVAAAYMQLAELPELAELAAAETDHQMLPMGGLEPQIQAGVAVELGITLRVAQAVPVW